MNKKKSVERPNNESLPQESTLQFVEELKRQWVATFDALIDPILIINSDFIIERANRAAAVQGRVDIKKVVGMKCHELLANRPKPCPGCKLAETLGSGRANQFPLEEVIAEKTFEVTSQPFTQSAEVKTPAKAVHIYRDRTEASIMQQKLVQNEKLASIGLLAGGIAHEINNPLGGIMIFSQLLLRELPKDSPFYSDVVEIEAAAQRCKQIVQSLLDFARIQPGTVKKAEFEPVDFIEAVDSALRFARINLKEKRNIQLEDVNQAQHTTVLGNKNQIIQVVLNLIQNAIQSMASGGKIDVVVENDKIKKNIILKVSDSGQGIDPENLKRIFDPFFTTKEPGEGTGLGLSICYGIINSMAGELSATSRKGKGSTFTVKLPLISAPD